MDVGDKYSGSLSGSMNMMGNLGGMVSPIVAAQILKFTDNNWGATFWVSAIVYLVGAAAWWFIDPVTPLEAGAKAEGSANAAALSVPALSVQQKK